MHVPYPAVAYENATEGLTSSRETGSTSWVVWVIVLGVLGSGQMVMSKDLEERKLDGRARRPGVDEFEWYYDVSETRVFTLMFESGRVCFSLALLKKGQSRNYWSWPHGLLQLGTVR